MGDQNVTRHIKLQEKKTKKETSKHNKVTWSR